LYTLALCDWGMVVAIICALRSELNFWSMRLSYLSTISGNIAKKGQLSNYCPTLKARGVTVFSMFLYWFCYLCYYSRNGIFYRIIAFSFNLEWTYQKTNQNNKQTNKQTNHALLKKFRICLYLGYIVVTKYQTFGLKLYTLQK